MDDIKIPNENDDDRLFIRSIDDDRLEDEIDFKKTSIHEHDDLEESSASSSIFEAPPSSKVTLRFDKFVQLVANHSYLDVIAKNAEEEVVISSNLLTDLANAHDRVNEKKMPLLFFAGLVIGIVLTYVFLK